MNGTIVVGVDASSPSRAAIDWAIARSASTLGEISLVHVIDERWLGTHVDHDDEARDQADSVIAGELGRVRMPPLAPRVTGRVVTGLPAQALMDAAADADLLAIGTHKTGFTYGRTFESKFLGLVSQSTCAVAVIPEFLGRSRRGVVVAAGVDAAATSAIRFATLEAARLAEELVLVAAWDVETLTGRRADNRAAMLSAAASVAREVDPSVTVRSRTSDTVMSEALIAASATASVLVLPRPGSGSDDPALAITHDVLANIASPVIVLGITTKGHHDPQRSNPSDPHLA